MPSLTELAHQPALNTTPSLSMRRYIYIGKDFRIRYLQCQAARSKKEQYLRFLHLSVEFGSPLILGRHNSSQQEIQAQIIRIEWNKLPESQLPELVVYNAQSTTLTRLTASAVRECATGTLLDMVFKENIVSVSSPAVRDIGYAMIFCQREQ